MPLTSGGGYTWSDDDNTDSLGAPDDEPDTDGFDSGDFNPVDPYDPGADSGDLASDDPDEVNDVGASRPGDSFNEIDDADTEGTAVTGGPGGTETVHTGGDTIDVTDGPLTDDEADTVAGGGFVDGQSTQYSGFTITRDTSNDPSNEFVISLPGGNVGRYRSLSKAQAVADSYAPADFPNIDGNPQTNGAGYASGDGGTTTDPASDTINDGQSPTDAARNAVNDAAQSDSFNTIAAAVGIVGAIVTLVGLAWDN